MSVYTPLYTPLYGGAYPQSILDVEVDILPSGSLNDAWSDITGDAYQRDTPAISITKGRPNQSSSATPSSCSLSINNRSGNYSFQNPMGLWYGQIGRNTPIRVSVPDEATYLRLEQDTISSASCPDAAGLNITGDTDLRVDVALSSFAGGGLGDAGTLAAKWASGGVSNSWLLSAGLDGTLVFWWSANGTSFSEATSTVPMPLGRLSVRVTLAVATGTVTFYTGPAGGAGGATWTQLGGTLTAGAGGVYSGTAPVTVGNGAPASAQLDGIYGSVYEFELRSGIGGTVEAHPVFTTQTAGATSFTDGQGNTWTMNGTAEISARSYRFHGEMSSSAKAQDPTGTDLYVPLICGGLLRRLQQGNAPEYSTMERGMLAQSGTLAPVAYWTCEDLQGSTMIGSATGGPSMTTAGGTGDGSVTTTGPAFAADSSFACSNPLPVLNGSTWFGSVPEYTSNGSIIVRFLLNVATGPANDARIMRIITTGTCTEFSLYFGTGGALGIIGYAAPGGGGVVFDSGLFAFAVVAEPLWLSMELQPGAGSTVHWSLVTLVPGASAGLATSGSFSGTIGNVTDVIPNPYGQCAGVTIGHISVQSAWESLYAMSQPLNAWIGETAGNRFARLCGENSLGARVYGYPATTAAMGAQPVDTLPDLLQQCEDADRGMIYEPRQAYALGYRTLVALENQAPAVTLSWTGGQLAASGFQPPADDDQLLINDVTAQRDSGGSSGASGASLRTFLDDGSQMSISPPPAGTGHYATSLDLNVEADTQLPDVAGWAVHMGTVNDSRYPAIPVDLARPAVSALFFALQDVNIGDYIQIGDTPAWLTPNLIKQLAAGATEQLGGYIWRITWNGIPESPYETGLFDDPVYGRADTDGSTLASPATPAATTLSVASVNPLLPLWTTLAADFPFDISIGGEQITVTGITGASSPQSFTVTRSVNGVVKAQDAGSDVRLFFPTIYAIS